MNNFCDLSHPIAMFDKIFHSALDSLQKDLRPPYWWVREREIVNFFVSGHLQPAFALHGLDPVQIGIESPVRKYKAVEREGRAARGAYRDIVIWPHAGATMWLGCKPLACIEWKHTSPICVVSQQSYERVVELLESNDEFMGIGYAVFSKRPDWTPPASVECRRIQQGR